MRNATSKPFVIKRSSPDLDKFLSRNDILEACEIIQALLLTTDAGHDARGGLAAFNGMREISEEFCKACERKGQSLHVGGFCECACHSARAFIKKHSKREAA